MGNKAFRPLSTLFVQGENLYPASLLLVIQGLFTFRQPITGMQGTDFYLGRIKFLHVERPSREKRSHIFQHHRETRGHRVRPRKFIEAARTEFIDNRYLFIQ